MTTDAPSPQITNNRISDTRRASADVTGMPELRTPSGRDPITPCGIDVEYSITTRRPGAIVVRGYRPGFAFPQAAVRRGIGDLSAAPNWVQRYVIDNRPPPLAEEETAPAAGRSPAAAADQLRGIADDIDAGQPVGPMAASILRLIAADLAPAAAPSDVHE